MLKDDSIESIQFLDKWPKQTNTTYKVVIADSPVLSMKAQQINKDALPIIIYFDNKKVFKDKINTNRTYVAKLDGETNNSLQIQQVIVGYDKNNKQVFSVYNPLGSEMIVNFPETTVSYSVGVRLSGDGEATISEFSLTTYNTAIAASKKELFTKNPERDYLIITNVYPEKNNYYQNMFIHRRALSYREKGINVDIYRLNTSPGSIASYTFEGIPVFISGEDELINLLNVKPYKKIFFHFINERMYDAVRKSQAKQTPKLVWVHGYETTKWYRRWFNFYQNTKGIRSALNQADGNQKQLDFMRKLYTTDDDDIKFIFVSNWYKEKIAEKDTNSIVKNYKVIHNVIDDELFNYVEKTAEQRKRILTIRPFASRTYANDLTVKAILALKDRPFFNDLDFDIYGQGPLFDEVVEPIRNIPNVHLHNYFLSQEQIAEQHKTHGIFLCPSRMDSQGVSLGEAMSSGLVPITNGICAIPEFIDESCGFLASNEDYIGLANAIEHLYHNPDDFLTKSNNAANRVRHQCSKNKMIRSELNEIIS